MFVLLNVIFKKQSC